MEPRRKGMFNKKRLSIVSRSMHTGQIVCPTCGKLVIVNVLGRSGETTTPCQKCKSGIIVATDQSGNVESIRSLRKSQPSRATSSKKKKGSRRKRPKYTEEEGEEG